MSHNLKSSKHMNNAEKAYLGFLIEFMGSDFFSREKNSYHPFYLDYWALQKQLQRDFSDGADNTKLITDALAQTTALMNAYTLSETSKKTGDPLLAFGDFSDFGSVKVREDVEGRLGALKTIEKERKAKGGKAKGRRAKGKNSESLISELCVASWLSSQCDDFESLQEDSMPDFVCIEKRLATECKAFLKAKSIENFLDGDHISKANEQLGKAKSHYGLELTGILAFDLTRYLASKERKLVPGTARIYPEEYFSVLDSEIVARISSRENIHWVIYYWDEVFPYSGVTLVSRSRHSRWVKSPENQSDEAPLESYGLRVAMNMHPAPLATDHGRLSPCPCGSGKRFKACHGRLS